MQVTKRNGSKVDYQVEKIHKVLEWATLDINGVSISDIEINANLNLYDGISTEEIHKVLIKSANDLISEETPNYQYVASRLLLYWLRKSTWGDSEPPRLFDHINKCVKNGIYDNEILKKYSESEIHKLGKYVKHSRDELFTYAGLQQLVDKYLVKNRITGEIFETPQFAYMLIAMIGFINYPENTRIDYVKKCYDYISTFKISLPTPIIAGLRTVIRQFASCILIDVDDSLNSIFSSATAVGYYSAKRAGIGLNCGAIRPIGSSIRNGEVQHTGVIPYLKVFESIVKSTSQNGIRGASGTVHVPIWHYEIEDIIVLKNNAGTDDNRVKKLDYSIQISKLFYERAIRDEEITLFSPAECRELYDNWGLPEFDALYLKREKDPKVKYKRKVKAKELFSLLIVERRETGRIYVMNIDHCNTHGSFTERVTMSNLCVSPETLVLTDEGYKEIKSLDKQFANIWNGDKFSKSFISKTSDSSKLLTVELSDGRKLDVTENHDWYIVKNYQNQARKIFNKVKTKDLKIGDKLIKFDFPFIEFNSKIKYPYTHGLLCADGTKENGGYRISLYGEKKNLVKYLDIENDRGEDSDNRRNISLPKDIAEKYFVPTDCSKENRLLWLAGYLDGDGTVVVNGDSQSIQATCTNRKFLSNIQLMLDTLGVASKITNHSLSGFKTLPDGHGGYKEYWCEEAWRLIIPCMETKKLLNLGLKCHRLQFSNTIPSRDSKHFVYIKSITDNNRYDETYCLNEPEKHLATFNGILTGQCQEITFPTKPLNHIDDPEGEIGVCILSSLNLLNVELNEYESVCDIIVRFLDEVIDYQTYPVKAAENFCKNRRALGVGFTNLAAFLAHNKIKYDSTEALALIENRSENLQYWLLNASCKLAEEKGKCSKFNTTKYAANLMPYNHYKKDVDSVFTKIESNLDWSGLSNRISKFGLRNCTLTAQMPVESSSVIQNATNGIEPVRELISYKKSKTGVLKQVVPGLSRYGKYYTRAFDVKSNKIFTDIAAVIQKWMDQSISTNHYYNYNHYENGFIPESVMLKDLLYSYKMGLKTLYYCNTPDGDDDTQIGCVGGACTL